MNVLEQANYRMKNREWEDGVKERRAAEFRAALERLDEAELRASFPDNENRIQQLEQIRRTRAEITAMMNEEFGMEDQYRRIADS
jgi:hypothetical protein